MSFLIIVANEIFFYFNLFVSLLFFYVIGLVGSLMGEF